MHQRIVIWTSSMLLCVVVLLLSLLGTFHDDLFYHYAYQRNGAYEQLDHELVWSVTENFQEYIDDEQELLLFDEQQASHLEDVKELYLLGISIMRVLIAIVVILLFTIIVIPDKGLSFTKMLIIAGAGIIVVSFLTALLALRWEWFFTQFHQVFFTGNWQFSNATLMIRLWGNNFFSLAAVYILLKNSIIAGLFFILAKAISPRSTSTSA